MKKINIPWLGLLGLAITLGFALKEMWKVPFWTTFWVVLTLYLGGAAWKALKEGFDETSREGIKKVGALVVSVVMFIILQYSFSFIERALRQGGNTDQQLWFLWMSIVTLISGGLGFAWFKGKYGIVIAALGVAVTLSTLQLGFPKYTATWANRDEISNTLETNGVLGASGKATWVFLFGKPAPESPRVVSRIAQPEMVEALVPVFEGYTPCSSFVGWEYVVRSDGYPLRIKYQRSDWIEISGKGEENEAPKTFQPGEAQFVSPDPLNLKVPVHIYKKVIVPKQ